MDRLPERLATDLHAAFPDLVRTTQDGLYTGLRRLGNRPEEAKDLCQETYVRAFRALSGYDRERIRDLRLRAWIWTIALNLGRNLARERRRRPYPTPLDMEQPVSDPEPVDTAAWDRRLARLSVAQRRAVVLRHVVGLSYEEVADSLGRPVGTIKADVHRALGKLRQVMEEEG